MTKRREPSCLFKHSFFYNHSWYAFFLKRWHLSIASFAIISLHIKHLFFFIYLHIALANSTLTRSCVQAKEKKWIKKERKFFWLKKKQNIMNVIHMGNLEMFLFVTSLRSLLPSSLSITSPKEIVVC